MAELDNLISQPARLKIMAALIALDEKEQLDFIYLRNLLQLTDGNLGAHLQKLEEASYIRVEKTFVAKKPRTYLSLTAKGRMAFDDHVAALKEIIGNSKKRK